VADHLAATQAALSQAAEQADLIITTGGVSVGEEDHVRHALLALGRLHLWKIAVKPGKPLAFGQINTTPFIGLPGNPVSAFVTFCLFVAPLLKKMQGLTQIHARACSLPAYFAWPTAGKRQEYLRARLAHVDGRLGLELYPHQGSGVLSSVSFSDGLVEVPIGTTIQHNEMVQFYFYSELLA
jgi:molybdopterin molybdotransferase